MDKITSSGYKAVNNEANFGKPIENEIVGGTHLAPEIITWDGEKFYAVHWFDGLPRHDKLNAIRFPHGLIIWGETIFDCAKRLVEEQLRMNVKSAKVLTIESYVDKENHWHIEPEILAKVSGNPRKPVKNSEIIIFELENTPEMAYWKSKKFKKFISNHLL
ncbi:MAG: hypothetical protein HYS62_01645 [Candidatus Aenigmarchaeota archaeon]|nr:hypothetical protein [Candidatus Aenigmarchaeota archaeon]